MTTKYDCSTCGAPATSYLLERGESKFACEAHVLEGQRWTSLDASTKETAGFGKKKR
jgi:hypothetical protein